jgi:hypothetical protein
MQFQSCLFCSYFGVFGSQEAVNKIGPKIGFSLNWSSNISEIVTVKAEHKGDLFQKFVKRIKF